MHQGHGHHHHGGHHGHGGRRRMSRHTLVLQNLPTRQTTSSLYTAFRLYGDINRIRWSDSSTAYVSYRSDRDATEMLRYEDARQIDGLPLIVAFAEPAADEEFHAARDAKPGPSEWKCWLCLHVNSDKDGACNGSNCDVPAGVAKKSFDATLCIDTMIPLFAHERCTVIATELPKNTGKEAVTRVFLRYGNIAGVWMPPSAEGTEAQITYTTEEAADESVEYEHCRQLLPIVVWKATSAFVIEIQPLKLPWLQNADAFNREHWIRQKYDHYGAITGVHVRPDVAYIEFPSFTSTLAFLQNERGVISVQDQPCYVSLSPRYSKWPCLSCGNTHNEATHRLCTGCSGIKPNFKLVNLPVIWPTVTDALNARVVTQKASMKEVPELDDASKVSDSPAGIVIDKNRLAQQQQQPQFPGVMQAPRPLSGTIAPQLNPMPQAPPLQMAQGRLQPSPASPHQPQQQHRQPQQQQQQPLARLQPMPVIVPSPPDMGIVPFPPAPQPPPPAPTQQQQQQQQQQSCQIIPARGPLPQPTAAAHLFPHQPPLMQPAVAAVPLQPPASYSGGAEPFLASVKPPPRQDAPADPLLVPEKLKTEEKDTVFAFDNFFGALLDQDTDEFQLPADAPDTSKDQPSEPTGQWGSEATGIIGGMVRSPSFDPWNPAAGGDDFSSHRNRALWGLDGLIPEAEAE
ncbi:hypothetical protein DIPPA_08121 [Diplonema papillatum]|nr:hypothetical protein DIPPA_08121 [Diplonema papillatum]